MGSRAQRAWFGRWEQTEEWQQIASASTPTMSDTPAAAALRGNGWEAMIVVCNRLIFFSVCPNNKCFLNFQRREEGAPDIQRKNKHEIKISAVNAPFFFPQISLFLVFQTQHFSNDSWAHSHMSQVGNGMPVRSQLSKSSSIAKGWEISPVLFILSYAAVLQYLTDARMQFLSFGVCFAVE